MTAKEATNIILRLMEEGWDGDKINAFIAYIETHLPTEDEVRKAFEKNGEHL